MNGGVIVNMTIDDILDATHEADDGEWIIRKTIDTGGDYDIPTYTILAVYSYGPKTIGSADGQPYNAILFAGAKKLAEEVRRLRAEVLGLKGASALAAPESPSAEQ